ncbi:MAG: DUF1501 domain-containing protein [Deltaproteobacteria bacterium]|nr:MAG: DUF1501 domain-containing protein [Deltaproteobacteria bacterium]
MSKPKSPRGLAVNRRTFLKSAVAVTGAAAFPHIWVQQPAYAGTSARGAVKHLLYIRLGGGFRFTAAFNGESASQFNPFGLADRAASGVDWGVGRMLAEASWLQGDDGQRRRDAGMRTVPDLANQIAVLPCVDHEPNANRADGNHGTGLERYLTGYVGGDTSFFTMINYALRERAAAIQAEGGIALPAFSLSDAGMSIGHGRYASFRPPVVQGDGFEGFGFDATSSLPEWAQALSARMDARARDRQNPFARDQVDAYLQTREATRSYSSIFNSDVLRIRNNSEEAVDGISNRQLGFLLGDTRAARHVRLALRLFGFGSPACFLNQGYYDMHSGEENGLPRQMDELNRLISGLDVALKTMDHPDGGTYWDHTLVVFGSEFGRTAGGNRFNSARGSDHGGDRATRWMSMPFMGGLIDEAGMGGRMIGETDRDDLQARDRVFSYRSVLKTLMDALGGDHREFFPGDLPTDALVRG